MDRIFSRVVEAVHDAEDGYERQADGTSALPEGFHIEMYVNARLGTTLPQATPECWSTQFQTSCFYT